MNDSFKNAWRTLSLACLCIVFLWIFPAQVALSDDGYVCYHSAIVPEEVENENITYTQSVRNQQFCEIMPLFNDEYNKRQVTESYSTFLTDTCEEYLWDEALSDETKAKFLAKYSYYGATDVILNGPRLWVLDEIENLFDEMPECTVENYGKKFSYVDGLQSQLGAQIQYRSEDKEIFESENEPPYSEKIVRRWTRWTYKAGNMVYELTNTNSAGKTGVPDVYIMQTIDLTKLNSPNELPYLVTKLETLPPGWAYSIRELKEDYCLEAHGDAVVIHDDMGSGYQRRTNLGRVACAKE